MRLLIGIGIVLLISGCSTATRPALKVGIWRGVLNLQGQPLPFNFEVIQDSIQGYRAILQNAQERLALDEIRFEEDSVIFRLHIFDAELKAKIDGDSLKGFFIRSYEKNYRIPFQAAFNQDFRFHKTEPYAAVDFNGKYAVTFSNEKDTTLAIGLFKQNGNYVEGTFLTPTGDYRFLEGNVVAEKMYLSAFDGNHAYVFHATKLNDSTLTGDYWSGKTLHQQWIAVKNEQATLPDPESLTYLKEGYDKIEFSFPDINGNIISLTDEKFKNKVVILQLFGTWCSNCMDETRFLMEWYTKNKSRGVEILGLAYEQKNDFIYASGRIKKMQQKLGVPYSFVIAGTADKSKASKSLPMLNRVVAFPTTIFIGKDGKVKKIHTGFSGPGTGVYFEHEVEHFNETVNACLAEGGNF